MTKCHAAQPTVLNLDDSNFDTSISSGFWFVQFYAPWCTSCMSNLTIWDKLRRHTTDLKEVSIALIDVDASPSFVERFSITAYPTYLLFLSGSQNGYQRYYGEVKPSGFEKFLRDEIMKKKQKTIILRYFESRGRAEIIRLTLEACSLSYSQNLHTREEWPEIKQAGYESGMLPFAQVPSLSINQQDLVQTQSIVRYIGSMYGLIPSNIATEIDILLCGVEDLRTHYSKLVYDPKFVFKKDNYVNKVLPMWLSHFERYLSKTKSNYLVGDVLTVADLALFDIVTVNLAISDTCLENFPLLQNHVKTISFHEPIREYLLSNRRPSYQNGDKAYFDNKKKSPSPYWRTLLKSLAKRPKHDEL